MSDERARLFVALELPDDARTTLLRWRARHVDEHAALRPTPPASLHLTLCFLGWREVAEIDAIAAACARVGAACDAVRLSLAEPVWLPPRGPRVLAVELVDQAGGLAQIQSALSGALAEGGWYRPEQRPFRAHVTVARVSKGARVRRVVLPAPPPHPLLGSTVTLFRSWLARGGARYEPLRRIELGEG